MGKHEELRLRILQGKSDANINFDELRHLLRWLGFKERTRGSHHLFRRNGVTNLINLQREGSKAKVYQVRQVGAPGRRPLWAGRREAVSLQKYEVIIYWGNEDQFFVAEVPELPGCMAHGSTPEAALAHANQAIQLWIDTALEFGDPIPEPKGEGPMPA